MYLYPRTQTNKRNNPLALIQLTAVCTQSGYGYRHSKITKLKSDRDHRDTHPFRSTRIEPDTKVLPNLRRQDEHLTTVVI